MKKALFNWSSGKDSALALHKALQDKQYNIAGLITTFNATNSRVSMHGIHQSLAEGQARQIGLPLHSVMLPENIDMERYDEIMSKALKAHKNNKVGIGIFGDILLEDLKEYREQQLQKAQMEAIFPLWQQSTDQLAREFIGSGFKAIVVSVNGSKLGKPFVGREYNASFLEDLPEGVDSCGENGEFHTFVYDGPIFKEPVQFEKADIVVKKYEQREEKNHDFNDGNYPRKEPHYFYQDIIIV